MSEEPRQQLRSRDVYRVNLLGAVLANVINITAISIFVARLLGKVDVGHWIGILILLSVVPLIYLLQTAASLHRRRMYFVWVGLMIAFVIVDFLLDWWPKVSFRDNMSIIIPYVMLFFGATGGMIGVASLAGKKWTIITTSSFLVMAVLAFVQRQVTGM